jgi:uncharacterized membrane protein YbhN (UPF0104 family)
MRTAKAHRRQNWMRGLFAIFSAIVFVVAAIVLYNAFRTLNWSAIEASIFQWRGRFVLAALLCSLSFGVVGLIEWRALRWAGSRISISQAFKVSFIANGLAHSLGAAAFVAAAVRGRLYARHGVGLTTSAAVTAFQTATSTSGVVALVGVACLIDYRTDPLRSGMGVLMLGAVALYLLACGLVRGSVRLWAYTFELPTIKGALVQIGLGAVDNALAIGSLFVLLPPKSVTYPTFVGDYAVAYVGGALSGIPGGAGPFEGLLVKLLPTLDLAGLGAAMLGFRLIFNLAPLLGAGVLFLIALAQDRGRISDGVVDMS